MQTTKVAAPFEIEIGASIEEILLIAEDDKSASGDLKIKLGSEQRQWIGRG